MSETSMIINYVPGEECRVALVADGNLEEFHNERTDAVSRVNNVYVGRVTNVEASIQAAFIDFGIGVNGFLHVSDLHPRYFASGDDDTTEKVGKKTPRKERPPIQHCLKRGQEIIVQVLKEGVGTKGPTLTSYLSIPGRFLVMMPQMDRVGVSRKVEDDDERKRMRDILKQLDLPDGFGFILRTAGFDRTKTELKRDLAYLMRLWKDMETRRSKGGNKPKLLYSESDLLVRSLRDLVSSDIKQIIIDDESAITRAVQFMKIVAPRSSAKVMRYTGREPIYHAFGIEQQLALTHAREVPLPSGGRLVIDETEAVVAIDVNSGKSRSARDAETNAYQTNVEAVDVICRQLRLRDLGGIVINDMIDMRSAKNRKSIESLFRDRLKRDRARTSIAPISPFGILEMTRQRMRGSLRSQHYTACPTCQGKGLVQRPNSVASEALRELAVLLESDKVQRVELVVSGRIAGELLSNRRGAINRLERQGNKQVEVRVSETLSVDRFTLYAYDEQGADVDIMRLPKLRNPKNNLEVVDTKAAKSDGWALDPAEDKRTLDQEEPPSRTEPVPDIFLEEQAAEAGDGEQAGTTSKKRRRRRRRRRKGDSDDVQQNTTEEGTVQGVSASTSVKDAADSESATQESSTSESSQQDEGADSEGTDQPVKKKRRRRRRRRKTTHAEGEVSIEQEAVSSQESEAKTEDRHETARESGQEEETADGSEQEPTRKKRRRRRSRKPAQEHNQTDQSSDAVAASQASDVESVGSVAAQSSTAQSSPTQGSPAPIKASDDSRASGTAGKKRRRKKVSRTPRAEESTAQGGSSAGTIEAKPAGEKDSAGDVQSAAAPVTKKKTRKRSAKKANKKSSKKTSTTASENASEPTSKTTSETARKSTTKKAAKKAPRTLYGSVRRKLSPSDIPVRREE